MKKIVAVLTATAGIALAGCQSAGNMQKLASSDFQNMSCTEIKTMFDAYQADSTMAGSLNGLLGIVSPTAAGSVTQAKAQADNAYLQARNAANAVMQAKGCSTRV